MTFPSVEDTATSAETSNVEYHDVFLPSNISSGDLLLAFVATDGDNIILDWDGFTSVKSLDNGTAASIHIGYKIATGSEGASITIQSDTSEQSAHATYRIEGHDSGAPYVSTGATGSSNRPDSDELDPGLGAQDFLWISVEGNDDDDAVSSYPSNYSIGQLSQISTTGNGTCHVGVAARQLNASSEDPGYFQIGNAEQYAAVTIAVAPEGAAPATKVMVTSMS